MHEMALVGSMLDTVIAAAREEGAERVLKVYLTIGKARDIVVDLFQDAFTYLAKGTVASDAELDIRRVPLTMRCHDCDLVFRIDLSDKHTWACPRCASKSYELNTGREFDIDRIEVA